MPGLSLKDTLDRPKQALCAMQNGAMDDIVLQAMVKWPKVPACYGWLGLDARGRWYLRDETVQSAGGFAQSKGDWLQHDKFLAFIASQRLWDWVWCIARMLHWLQTPLKRGTGSYRT